MTEKFKINVARHIEDIDDLREKGDAGINQEKKHHAFEIADQLLKEAEESNSKIIFFAISPRKRVQETTEVVRERIREQSSLRTVVTIEEGLKEIYQGDFNLPSDYENGQLVPELKEAWEVFWSETFEKRNLLYRFGSSVNKYGEITYPSLANFFLKTGENYTEFCLRLYTSILKIAQNPSLIDRKDIKIAVMTHAAPLSIFMELENIGRKIVEENYDFETGSLMQLCWENFKMRGVDVATKFGHVESLTADYLYDQVVVEKLKKEVNSMESNLQKT